MIDRYRFIRDTQADCYCDMDLALTGDYVHYDDYVELEDEKKELLKFISDMYRDVPMDIDTKRMFKFQLDRYAIKVGE